MKINVSVTAAFLLCTLTAIPQSSKMDKKMEKVQEYVDKGKLEKADEYLEEVLNENPEFGQGWDYLAKIRYKEYRDIKKTDVIFNGNITVTTTDKDGKKAKGGSDSLASALMEMMKSVSPSKVALSKYFYTMRKGMLTADDAYNSSFVVRNYFVDIEIDTAVNKKALKYFNNAEEEFKNKNYENAAKLYRRAIEEQPDFYKASLYMGDCFYFTENYVNAVLSFKEAVQKFPFLLEPRKYLIDSYGKSKLYDNALEECIKAMAVYPDQSIPEKMSDAAYYLNKKIDIKWTPRGVFPHRLDSSQKDLTLYKEEKKSKVAEPWTHYNAALPKIREFCNTDGMIVQKNSLTTTKYLELYAWEEMLKSSADPSLEQARKMQKDGYLDCYVLVTCYHFDFYKQYADFASKNKDKITDYYKKYLVSR